MSSAKQVSWPACDAGYEQAKVRWPGVEVPQQAFIDAARARSPSGDVALVWEDLYLVLAAVAGAPAALAELNHVVEAQRRALLHLGLDHDAVSDVLSQLREWLLVPVDGKLRLARFAATGSLAGWLRTIAVRQALRVQRAKPETRSVGELDAAVGHSPELSAIREELRDAFTAALRKALAELPPRDRTVLRQYFVERMSIDTLGEHYGVHRATAARWVAAAQRSTLSGVRRQMLATHGLGRSELNSALRLMRSQLDLSLRVLGSGG